MKMADYNPPLKVYYDADWYKAYQISTLSKALEFKDRVSMKAHTRKNLNKVKQDQSNWKVFLTIIAKNT